MTTMRSRRFIASSSEYEPPLPSNFEQDLDARLRLLNLLEQPPPVPLSDQASPGESGVELARMLSTKSVISTASSFTAQQSRAQELSSAAQVCRKIGAGACGSVFAVDGRSTAYKICKTGTVVSDGDDPALRIDYEMHLRIAKALRDAQANIEIPTCHFFVDRDDGEWWNNHSMLAAVAEDANCHVPAHVLVTERILPLPGPARAHIIQQFCKESLREKASADPANRDCLVRIYLGSMRGRTTAFFSLRNFKLHLNQMTEIGLDYEALAVSMGEALAIIHWSARTDGRDIEFVLGSSAANREDHQLEGLNAATTGEDFTRHETRLFVLDFNQVQEISMDDAGVELAVKAFTINDPYYPRPCQASKAEQELWNSFVRSYLSTADNVLATQSELRILPRKFISGLPDHFRA